MAQFQSLSRSPAESSKTIILNRPIKSESVTGSLLPSQGMSGPSFDYESYQQHTGLVTGAIANTHAINQSLLYGNGYLTADSGMDFNFNSPLIPQASPFDSPVSDTMDAANASPVRQTVDPSRLSQSESSQSILSPTNMRVYNGFHTNQAAAAAEAAKSKVKAEAQQLQQQQIIQQQQQQQQRHAAQSAKPQKPRVQPVADPLLDQKISQVLNSFRQQQDSSPLDLQSPPSPADGDRSQSKELDDMDEDERLLNSEAGKKLSPKERRQLRNKVSARHFRKRRKEMIGGLEAVNQDLAREVNTLKMEKERLFSDYQNLRKFVEHMISTPNFAGYMQEQVLGLSSQQASMASPQTAPQPRQRQRSQQLQQQFGMSMIPEQHETLQLADVLTEDALFPDDAMNDFGNMPMLSQNSADFDMFSENTQIFAVLDTPSPPIDISALSGKTSNFVGQQESFESHEEKVEVPPIDTAPSTVPKPAIVEKAEIPATVDEDFENDPAFALYHSSTGVAEPVRSDEPVELDTDGLSHVDIFGGIELEKVFERYKLVDVSEEEVGAALAMERVQRISSTVEDVAARLELMTVNL